MARLHQEGTKLSTTLNAGYNSIQPAAKYLHWLIDGWFPFRRIRRQMTELYLADESAVNDLAVRWNAGCRN